MKRPTIDELCKWLANPIADALGDQYGKLDVLLLRYKKFEVSLLSQPTMVADGTTVLLLRDSLGRSRAVVLCSAPISPDMVQRAMNRALQAKVALGASAGTPILDPLAQGHVEGLSYAILPFCNGLSESRPVWWVQRALLRSPIFDWLLRATECTVRDAEPSTIDCSFAEPLRYMASLKPINDRLQAAASQAAGRLATGTWIPRHVLMHGDLWKGNILLRPEGRTFQLPKMSDRFVIIDWTGSEIYGYAIFDLVRLARSMQLNTRYLRREVDRHCHLLKCAPADAMSYLLAALGHVAMNLEHFPANRFVQLAESCYTTLARTSD